MAAPKLENADAPNPDPETPPQPVEVQPPDVASAEEDVELTETEEACVVVKEDATPRGRRMADEAREVAAAHASMLVDIEACKRVSMSRRLYSYIYSFDSLLCCLKQTLVQYHCLTFYCYFTFGARVSFASTPSVTPRCRTVRSEWTVMVTSFTILRRTFMM